MPDERIWEKSYEAGADLSAAQFKFVKISAANTVAVAGAGEKAIGILQNDPTAGRAAEVRALGQSQLVVNGLSVPIAAGDELEVTTLGVGIKSTADKKWVCAIAEEAATADGVQISVSLFGPRQSSL